MVDPQPATMRCQTSPLEDHPWPRRPGGWRGLLLGLLAVPAGALELTEGPVLTPAARAPLSCVLELKTSEPARLTVEATAADHGWRRHFFRYDTTHKVALHGFRAGRSYSVKVTAEGLDGTREAAAETLAFNTASAPVHFAWFKTQVSEPEQMEPGYTLLRPNGGFYPYPMALDAEGEAVWYSLDTSSGYPISLRNGHLLIGTETNRLVEVDFLGETQREWALDGIYHHAYSETPHGTILTLLFATETVTDYPGSTSDPDAPPVTEEVTYDVVAEISQADGQLVNSWSMLDLLDPRRVSHSSRYRNTITEGRDWSHANSVEYDPTDDSILVSLRNQDAVIKFSRATGELLWILGPPGNWQPTFQPFLFAPSGTPFEWQFHQHAASLTASGSVMLFDNGNFRAVAFDPPLRHNETYSRAVEYAVDTATMQVRQVWAYGGSPKERLYCPAHGDVDWLPLRDNVLVTFGWLNYVDGMPQTKEARITELTHTDPPEKLFEVVLRSPNPDHAEFGAGVYRCERIFDFYPAGDLDLDGDVDAADLCRVIRSLGEPALSPLDPRDLDRDGTITESDATRLVTQFWRGSPPGESAPFRSLGEALGEIGLDKLVCTGFEVPPAAIFTVTAWEMSVEGETILTVEGLPGLKGIVQRSHDLRSWENWQIVAFTAAQQVITDPLPTTDDARRFYRVVLP